MFIVIDFLSSPNFLSFSYTSIIFTSSINGSHKSLIIHVIAKKLDSVSLVSLISSNSCSSIMNLLLGTIIDISL